MRSQPCAGSLSQVRASHIDLDSVTVRTTAKLGNVDSFESICSLACTRVFFFKLSVQSCISIYLTRTGEDLHFAATPELGDT